MRYLNLCLPIRLIIIRLIRISQIINHVLFNNLLVVFLMNIGKQDTENSTKGRIIEPSVESNRNKTWFSFLLKGTSYQNYFFIIFLFTLVENIIATYNFNRWWIPMAAIGGI